jgi:hypothetical protein
MWTLQIICGFVSRPLPIAPFPARQNTALLKRDRKTPSACEAGPQTEGSTALETA